MRETVIVAALAALAAGAAGCQTKDVSPDPGISVREINGAKFEIADAAVASNCLSLRFAVRAFLPPAGVDRQAFFPPAKSIDVLVVASDGELSAHFLGGGGGGGGDEEDGRIWMQQEALYSLPQPLPEGEKATLDITVSLDDDFASAEPLTYRIPVVAGPGGGTCP